MQFGINTFNNINFDDINFLCPFIIIYVLMFNNDLSYLCNIYKLNINNIIIYSIICGIITYFIEAKKIVSQNKKIRNNLIFKYNFDLFQIIKISFYYLFDAFLIYGLVHNILFIVSKFLNVNVIFGIFFGSSFINFILATNLAKIIKQNIIINIIIKESFFSSESELEESETESDISNKSEELNLSSSVSELEKSEKSESEESETESDMSNKSTCFDIPEKLIIFRDEEMLSKEYFENMTKLLLEPMITKTETIKILFEYIKYYELYQLNEDGTYNKQSIKPDNGLKKLFNYNNESNDVITIKEFIIYVDKLFEK